MSFQAKQWRQGTMAEDRKDEAKAPHWTSGQLTEASSHPHSPEIKEQGSTSAGLVRSANGFPYQEDEEPGLGGHEQPGTYARTKENGINGELSAGDRETAGNMPRYPAMKYRALQTTDWFSSKGKY